MKNFGISTLLSILLILVSFNQINAQNTLSSNENKTLMAVNKYLKSVNLDEGEILNKKMLDDFVQLSTNDNWYNHIKFWTSAQWGVKEANGAVAKQYELTGSEMKTIGIDKRPTKVSEGSFYGIKYDGENDYIENSDLKVEQPLSLLIVYKANPSNDANVLISTNGDKKDQVSIQKNNSGESELVINCAGAVRVKGIKEGINIIYIEYDFKNSKVYINGELAYDNILGKSEIEGIILGQGKINNKYNNFNGVLYETGVISGILKDDARADLMKFMKDIYHIN